MWQMPNVVVWAAVDGMPYWPAVILDPKTALSKLDPGEKLPEVTSKNRTIEFFDEEQSLAVINVDILQEYTSNIGYIRKSRGYINDIILACRRANVWIETRGVSIQQKKLRAPFFMVLELEDMSMRCDAALSIFAEHSVFAPNNFIDDILLSHAQSLVPPLEAGIVVWARLEGWPWWPGVILEREWCMEWITAQNTHTDEARGDKRVNFFNDSDHIYALKPENLLEYTSNMSKVHDAGSYKQAVLEACKCANEWILSNGTSFQRRKVKDPDFKDIAKPRGENLEGEEGEEAHPSLDLSMTHFNDMCIPGMEGATELEFPSSTDNLETMWESLLLDPSQNSGVKSKNPISQRPFSADVDMSKGIELGKRGSDVEQSESLAQKKPYVPTKANSSTDEMPGIPSDNAQLTKKYSSVAETEIDGSNRVRPPGNSALGESRSATLVANGSQSSRLILCSSQAVGSKSSPLPQRRAFGERMRKTGQWKKKLNEEGIQVRSSESVMTGLQNSSEEVLHTGSAFEAALKRLQACKEVLVKEVQLLQQTKSTLEANILALQRKKRHLLKKVALMEGKDRMDMGDGER